jgi:hypothetical protein
MRTFITSRIIGDIIIRPTGEVKSLSDWIKEMKSLSYKRGKQMTGEKDIFSRDEFIKLKS